ncbi:MAG: undecaprenyldiphospho-muramoylpentapeptide beta-N-acetylglucosaminyltransferase [Tissierellales bacterium]|nr:undecaprenyldiphospho-muramoylpentapeptide beta-N-acetylglucosaminyltransferase [Tissierellales bacterium]MBN2827662.1 undecaprenyldiphospho-muramoylpentapeptide beta-N-acetylglucosaminyltransferase [Tissierellales bacterium]
MKYVISGGGTGGHISPALAIIEWLRQNDTLSELIYVGSKNSLESKIVPKENIKFLTVSTGYINRKILSFSNIKTLFSNIKGLIEAIIIMKKEKPDIAIGTGGFVSGPVLLAAKICGVKTAIHEQNAFPGITNKLLSNYVDLVMISFQEASKYFPKAKKIILTGNPVRQDLFIKKRDESRKELRISNDVFFVYSFGGSGGQGSLNDAIIELIKQIIDDKKIMLLHVTGKRHYEKFLNHIKSAFITKLPDHISIVDYMENAPMILNACDLVIGSGGAITIAEITALGLPSILVPKAYTAENHQEKNARNIESHGAAFVYLESEINGEKLYECIKSLIDNPGLYHQMSQRSSSLAHQDASEKIGLMISCLLKENRNE